MFMTYIKLVAAVFMLAQPVEYVDDASQVGEAVNLSPATPLPAPRPEKAQIHRAAGIRAEEAKVAAPARVAKQAKPNSSDMPRAKAADLQLAAQAAAESKTTPASNAGSPPMDSAAVDSNSNPRTTQQQVMAAMTVAERLTAATAASIDADHLVAILMARLEIKSVSDLAGKNVAIDGRQFNGNVRIAIAAAGATAVQLSEDQTRAIDRLINAEVPAAVLTLVSPEAADGFPEVAGFRIFRIPLSPRSLQRG